MTTEATDPVALDPVGPPPRVLAVGALGAVLLWLAQAPAALWPLAWVAPACWLWLAESPAPFGRRETLRLWLAGSLYWFLTVHWVRLPHPLTPLGWAPLAMYLGLYPTAMVLLVRAARRQGAPLWVAGPVVWTGLELLQARLFTGFLMGAVSHSQAGQAWLRGVAAYVGAYGVTFLVVLFAATLAQALRRRTPAAVVAVAASLLLAVGAGWASRASIAIETVEGPRPRVALIQGDTRATWDPDPQRGQRIMERQMALSAAAHAQAQRDGRPLDLVVWPECMFRSPLYTYAGAMEPPEGADPSLVAMSKSTGEWLALLAATVDNTPALVGMDRFNWVRASEANPDEAEVYNCALLAGGDGQPIAYYDKTHLVPFGEYIPFASGLPILYYLTPMSGGLGAGAGPVALEAPLRAGGVLRLCPTICYETVVPHVVRSHVATLTADGGRPDALVNVTNDAWFWGSSELDLHLACGVYRAVECGLPLVVAANGGLSAVIDARGEVVALGPRLAEDALVADLPPRTAEPTPYAVWGDVFAAACLLAALALGVGGWGPGARGQG